MSLNTNEDHNKKKHIIFCYAIYVKRGYKDITRKNYIFKICQYYSVSEDKNQISVWSTELYH